MTKQEYKHIRDLAWTLLLEAGISSLPVDIKVIARIYGLEPLCDDSKPLYDNALTVSSAILQIYGYNCNAELSECLAVRLLCPMIVLKAISIQSVEALSTITQLPLNLARKRFRRYEMLLRRNMFEQSRLESLVLSQFQDWISRR